MFHNNNLNFIVATEIQNIDEKAYDFLKSIQTRFTALRLYQSPPLSDPSSHSLSKLCLNQNFKTELTSILNQYNTNKKIWATQQSMQSLNQIRSQVDQVTEIMRTNIDTVLDRGEALEDMICRADDLQATSNQFHQQTTQIHRNIWWHNMKWKLILGLLIVGIIAILVLVIGHHTKPEPTPEPTVPALEN